MAGTFFELQYIWLGVKGYEVTNKQGAVNPPVKPGDDPLQWKNVSFWTWTYKNGLAEAAKKFLDDMGEVEVERATAPVSMRSLDGTGPCCFGNVKLNGRNQIMRHGWQVQGDQSLRDPIDKGTHLLYARPLNLCQPG